MLVMFNFTTCIYDCLQQNSQCLFQMHDSGDHSQCAGDNWGDHEAIYVSNDIHLSWLIKYMISLGLLGLRLPLVLTPHVIMTPRCVLAIRFVLRFLSEGSTYWI
jgi:hypothetical protein